MRYIDIIRGNVDNHRARRGITQRALGEAVGISRPAFSAKLHGHSPFDIGLLLRVAAVLQVDVRELMEDIEQAEDLAHEEPKQEGAAA